MAIDKFKKQNALINAFISDKVVYKEVHHDLLNLFMMTIQDLYLKHDNNFNIINIDKELICAKANIDISTPVFPYLKELVDIKYQFTKKDIARLNKLGLSITNKISAFIIDVEELTYGDKRSKKYKITFNKNLFSYLLDNEFCIKHGNYTVIRNTNINSLKSKYQKMLAEIILSNKFKKEFDLDYEELRIKFGIANKPFSYLTKILKKHLPILQENFMDFDYEYHKKDKKMSIYLK